MVFDYLILTFDYAVFKVLAGLFPAVLLTFGKIAEDFEVLFFKEEPEIV